MGGTPIRVIPLLVALLPMLWSRPGNADTSIPFDFAGRHNDKSLTLLIQDGWHVDKGWLEPKWKALCASPCSGSLPAGTYRAAVSVDGEAPVETDERLELTQPSTLRGSYVSHSSIRTTGYVVMLGVPALSLLANFSGTESCDTSYCSDSDDHSSYVWLGIGVTGFLGGLVMTLIDDASTVTVVPLTRGSSDTGSSPSVDVFRPMGLAATGRF